MARVQMRQDSVFMSTQEIWYTLWPTSFTKFRLFVEGDLHPTLWDPALLIIMAFPMWLLFGAPGAFLFIRDRPNRGSMTEEQDEDSFYVLENLARAANEDGYGDDIQWGEEDLDESIRKPGEVPDEWTTAKDKKKAKKKKKK